MKFYYTYVLLSQKDLKLYIGFSRNVFRRLKQHNNGENQSTKHRRPFLLIFFEAYLFKEDALKREYYFKTAKGKRALKLMLSSTFKKLDKKHQ